MPGSSSGSAKSSSSASSSDCNCPVVDIYHDGNEIDPTVVHPYEECKWATSFSLGTFPAGTCTAYFNIQWVCGVVTVEAHSAIPFTPCDTEAEVNIISHTPILVEITYLSCAEGCPEVVVTVTE